VINQLNQLDGIEIDNAMLFRSKSVTMGIPASKCGLEHKKLGRSMSEPSDKQRPQVQPNSSRYKTELCRPFEENGK